MIKIEMLKTFNAEGAIHGMRHPLESHHLSDSDYVEGEYKVGEKDLGLMNRLFNAGNDHRKYLRQMIVSFTVTAPLYWWKEFDTYKVGTTANSTSTMHTIHKKQFTPNLFSHEHMQEGAIEKICDSLNSLRDTYLQFLNKKIWYAIIQELPSSWNQTRTVTCNYENLYNMYFSRKGHKLDEWVDFCKTIETDIPYFNEIKKPLTKNK